MQITFLQRSGASTSADAREDDGRLWLRTQDFANVTGWTPKPEGLCQDDICMPQPPGSSWIDDTGHVDLTAFADRLRLPLVYDADHAICALGSPARRDDDASEFAPDFALPDLDGVTRQLSDYRGRKVLLLAWASY